MCTVTEIYHQEQAKRVSSGGNQFRNVYSPKVLSDPYVQDQHRRVVEGLEQSCREQKLYCREAAQARRWIEQEEKRRATCCPCEGRRLKDIPKPAALCFCRYAILQRMAKSGSA